MVFEKIKRAFSNSINEFDDEEYLEIDLGQEKTNKKVLVKLFALKQYEDVNQILNALRDGYTIAIIDIKILKQKDSIELKRAVSKIKKTVDALEGSIAGFGEDIVIATPSFARIYKIINTHTIQKYLIIYKSFAVYHYGVVISLWKNETTLYNMGIILAGLHMKHHLCSQDHCSQ